MFGNKPGQRIIELAETDSTNSYAARLLHDAFPEEGTVVFSAYQIAGRGQRGSNWESEKGKNLLISYILYPVFLDISNQFLLNQVVALSVAESLQPFTSAKIAVKWPNDILANRHKIAGILIENSIRNGKITHSIVGAGINVNQTRFGAYTPPATSLSRLEKRDFMIREVLGSLNNSLDKWYNLLRLGQYPKIRSEYLKKLYLFGITGRYESEGLEFEGMITGIREDGRLEITPGAQPPRLFSNKEVRFLFG